MAKVIVLGHDSKLSERIKRTQPGKRAKHGPVDVEFMNLAHASALRHRRPKAIVLDVRNPNPTTIDVISRMRRGQHPPSLMLQVTPKQMLEADWTQVMPEARTALFTSKTSQVKVWNLLNDLLEQSPLAAQPSKSPSDSEWHSLNDRRIDLILKKRDGELTESESEELGLLQGKASRHVDRGRSLDFDGLAAFKAKAKELVDGQ